jgi:fibronectin-binding autotransporter adhesin
MASVTWTATGSGTWSQGANWSTGAAPLAGDDVTISFASPTSSTITYGPGSTAPLILDSLNVSNAAFDFASGTLAVVNGYGFTGLAVGGGSLTLGDASLGYISGSVSLTGGTTRLVGSAQIYSGSATQTAGTLQIDHGTLTDLDSTSNFTGTIQGSGGLVLESANVNLSAGFALKVASTTIESGNVSLNENLSYGNDFTLAQAGTLNVLGATGGKANALTLSGLSSLNGVIANSIVDITGIGHSNGHLQPAWRHQSGV